MGVQQDVSLYRMSPNKLKTDSDFVVGGNVFMGASQVDVMQKLQLLDSESVSDCRCLRLIATCGCVGLLSKFIFAPTTLAVGPGQQYPNLEDAWAFVQGKVLRAQVTLQLARGVHEYSRELVIGYAIDARNIIVSGSRVLAERRVTRRSMRRFAAIPTRLRTTFFSPAQLHPPFRSHGCRAYGWSG